MLSHMFAAAMSQIAPALSTRIRLSSKAGQPFSQSAAPVSSIGAPVSYALTAGTLPTGVTLNTSTGLLSGTTTTVGTYNFSVRATDAGAATETADYAVTVTQSIVTITNPTTLATGAENSAYGPIGLAHTGTYGSVTWSVAGGVLPQGLSLATGGAISGTPTIPGVYTFQARVTDTYGNEATKSFTITINATAIVLTVNPTTAPAATRGVAYTVTFASPNAIGSKTWSRLSGTFPTGLTLNASTGVLSGTPTATGTFSFTMKVQDANGNVGTRAYSVTVSAAVGTISPASLSSGTVGTAYSVQFSVNLPGTVKTWSKQSGTFPTGLSISSSTGVLSGTPSAAGTYSFVVRVVDNFGNAATRSYTMTVAVGVGQIGYVEDGLLATFSGDGMGGFTPTQVMNTWGNIHKVMAGPLSDGRVIFQVVIPDSDPFNEIVAITAYISGRPTWAGQTWMLVDVSSTQYTDINHGSAIISIKRMA